MLDNSPYVCVVIDGNGYKIHENVLQLGKKGGLEAAGRLRDEAIDYIQQLADTNDYTRLVYIYSLTSEACWLAVLLTIFL